MPYEYLVWAFLGAITEEMAVLMRELEPSREVLIS